jgi:hypothetical protein
MWAAVTAFQNLSVAHLLFSAHQVAAQQGSYAVRVLNKGYVVGPGGRDDLPPSRPAVSLISVLRGGSSAPSNSNEGGGAENNSYDELAMKVLEPGADLNYYTRPFGAVLPLIRVCGVNP